MTLNLKTPWHPSNAERWFDESFDLSDPEIQDESDDWQQINMLISLISKKTFTKFEGGSWTELFWRRCPEMINDLFNIGDLKIQGSHLKIQ